MVVDSLFDVYMLTIGVFLLNIFWDVFHGLGLVIIPFVVMVVDHLKKAMEERSSYKFTPGAVADKVAVHAMAMFVTFALCVVPFMPYELASIKFSGRQCSTSVDTYADDVKEDVFEKSFEKSEAFIRDANGVDRPLKVPVLLYLAVTSFSGIKAWVVSDLPCELDIRFVVDVTENQRITDPNLKKETADFVRQCYEKANFYLRERDEVVPQYDDWPGSKYLRDNVYSNAQGIGLYSEIPRPGFGTTTNELPNYPKTSLPEGYGFPTCKEWWNGVGEVEPYYDSNALSTRLFNHMEKWLRDNNFEAAVKLYHAHRTGDEYSGININGAVDPQERTSARDITLKQSFFTDFKLDKLEGMKTVDYGGVGQGDNNAVDWFGRVAAIYGSVKELPGTVAGSSAIRIGMPMAKSVALMVLIALYLPICILVSYQFKKVGMFYIVMGSLLCWPIWWELARTIDDNMSSTMGLDWKNPMFSLVSTYLYEGFYMYIPLMVTSVLAAFGVTGLPTSEMTRTVSPTASAANNAGKDITGKAADGVSTVANVATGGKVGMAKAAMKQANSKAPGGNTRKAPKVPKGKP